MSVSNISDWPALQTWLDKHHARFCYSLLPRTEHKITPSIEAWKVNGRILHVVLYPDAKGWDLVTSCDDNSTERTLEDAERRLGLAERGLGLPAPNLLAPNQPGDPFMAFVQRGIAAQQAVDTAIDVRGLLAANAAQASTLAEIVRVYLDFVEKNRSDQVDLDDRVTARNEMTKYEELLKKLSGWTPNLATASDVESKSKNKPSKPKKGKKAKR